LVSLVWPRIAGSKEDRFLDAEGRCQVPTKLIAGADPEVDRVVEEEICARARQCAADRGETPVFQEALVSVSLVI